VNPLQNQGGARQLYLKEKPLPVDVDRIKKLFRGELPNDKFWPFIRDRYWMQWGGLSDPFDRFEQQSGVGLDLLKFFGEIKYPICFSTKGTWWTQDERYMDLFRENSNIWNVKFSIINTDAGRSSAIETGCPSPESRLMAIHALRKYSSCRVTLRLRPFIIGMSDVNDEYLDLIWRAKAMGASALSTEFFCIEGRILDTSRYDRISNALGFDILDFYRTNSSAKSGYMRLNWKIKQPYVDKMERLCKQLKMRFYVSDAHHKDRCMGGSCCGLPPGSNYHKGQFTEALYLAKKNGEVKFSDISVSIAPCFRELRAVEAVNFMRGTPSQRARFYNFTVFDMFRYFWNNPNHSKSPYKYFGGCLQPVRTDDQGDIVYQYVGYQ
jgi:DNA repair photolyase